MSDEAVRESAGAGRGKRKIRTVENNPPGSSQLRRSKRLMSAKEKAEPSPKEIITEPTSAVGFFQKIPIELCHLIFSQLNLYDLSVVSLCSKEMRNLVADFHNVSSNFRRCFPVVRKAPTLPLTVKRKFTLEYYTVGVYIKRLTCLYPTKERMKFFMNYAKKIFGQARLGIWTIEGNNLLCETLTCYGTLFHTFIAGWEDSECIYVHRVMEQISQMSKYVPSVLKNSVGSNSSTEMYIRCYYNLVYIRCARTCREQAFWITRVLKPLPIVYQAKLVYIIFGPIDGNDTICWNAVINEDFAFNEQMYHTDLASCFNMLQKCTNEWSPDDIMSMFEDLIGTPSPWLKENVATLLLLCAGPMTKFYLENKLANGKPGEMAELLCYMVLVCSRHGYCVKKPLDLFQKIFYTISDLQLRRCLFRAIQQAHENLTLKLFLDFVQSGYDEERQIDFQNYVKEWSFFTNMMGDVMYFTKNSGNFTREE